MGKLTRRWRSDDLNENLQIWLFFPVDRGSHLCLARSGLTSSLPV
jgi:hypothetical protein